MINSNEERMVIDLSDATNITELGIKITSVLESDNTKDKEIFLNLGKIDMKQSQLLSIKALIEAMQAVLAGIETTSEMTETAAIGLGLVVGKVQQQVKPKLEESFKLDLPPVVDSALKQEPAQEEELSSFSQLKKMNSIGDFVTDTKSLTEVQDENLQAETDKFLEEAQAESEPADSQENASGNIYDSISKSPTPDDIQDALDATFGVASRANIPQENPVEEVVEEPKFESLADASHIVAEEVKSEENEEVKEETKENVVEDVFAPITMSDRFDDYEVTELREKTEESKYVLLDTEGITPEGIELIKSNTSDLPTLYLTQTLRSGQTVSYEGNIFLIGDAHPGSEINATGDVTVWGILGGIVHAGFKGNTDAKVRALKLNPIQLRIAHLYSRRNDTVNVPYVQKSNEFTPEEARIENEQIVIYKTLRRED